MKNWVKYLVTESLTILWETIVFPVIWALTLVGVVFALGEFLSRVL